MKIFVSLLLAFNIVFTYINPGHSQVPTPMPTPNPLEVDLNHDGTIDARDYFIFMKYWQLRDIYTPTPSESFTSQPTSTVTETPTPSLSDTPSATVTETLTKTFTDTPTEVIVPTLEQTIIIELPDFPVEAYSLKLIRIPAGTFKMGSLDYEQGHDGDEGPVHQVTIGSDFYIGETEVTQAQWEVMMAGIPFPSYGHGFNYPVYNVSWDDCQVFISQLNTLGQGTFRLPTEAEWEYACRAGTQTRFYFGNSPTWTCNDDCDDCLAGSLTGNRSDFMWYCGNNGSPNTNGPKQVRSKLPNAFGLYDMSGNLYEWCQDWYQNDFYNTPDATTISPVCVNPVFGNRVRRGGSWEGYNTNCRSANRAYSSPTARGAELGFRVVWDP